MIKHGYEGLTEESPIKDKLPQLIEYYVKFYGEKHRQEITDKLNNTIFIFAENQSEEYCKKIDRRFDKLIEEDASNGGKNKEYLENERAKVKKQFMSAKPRRYRRELENNCQNYIAYYLKEIFKFSNDQLSDVKKLAKDYIPLLKLGRNSYFKIYENNEEKMQFNELVEKIAELKGLKSQEEYPNEFKEAVKYLSSIKKVNALKGQMKEFVDTYNNKMSVYVRGVVGDIIRSGVAYAYDVVEEIEEYIRMGDGLIALTTVSINIDNPVRPICICCNNEAIMLDDRTFMHEVNHAVTSNASFKDDFFKNKSGITEFTYYVFNSDCIKRIDNDERYNALDEIINDYLSYKVYKMAKADGFTVGGHDEIESLYSAAFPMFEEFLESHLSDIKEIVLSKDGKAMENYLGLKNLIKLADFATDMLNYCQKNVCDKYYRKLVKIEGGDTETDFFKLAKRKNEASLLPYKKYLEFYSKGEKIFEEINAYLDSQKKTEEKKEVKVKRSFNYSLEEGKM